MMVTVAVAWVVVVSVMVESSVMVGEATVVDSVNVVVVVARGILVLMHEQPAETTSEAKILMADLKGIRGVPWREHRAF